VVPAAGLLDRYFAASIGLHVGALAGAIVDRPGATGFAAGHSAARAQMSQRVTLTRSGSPYAQSGNCAIRRDAFFSVGGFDERARSGEDADLCFRLARAGWGLEERAGAAVDHLTAPSAGALLRQLVRHGSGAAWLERRYPGEFPAPPVSELARRFGHYGLAAAGALARRRPRVAAAALLELASLCAFDLGRLLSNDP
jgi:GT2 family glycosyltransferase